MLNIKSMIAIIVFDIAYDQSYELYTLLELDDGIVIDSYKKITVLVNPTIPNKTNITFNKIIVIFFVSYFV